MSEDSYVFSLYWRLISFWPGSAAVPSSDVAALTFFVTASLGEHNYGSKVGWSSPSNAPPWLVAGGSFICDSITSPTNLDSAVELSFSFDLIVVSIFELLPFLSILR